MIILSPDIDAVVTIQFKDQNKKLITPNEARWWIMSDSGADINTKSEIVPLEMKSSVVVSKDFLTSNTVQYFCVEGEYTSTLGILSFSTWKKMSIRWSLLS